MGTATAIMIVCDNRYERGGRGGHGSAAGVAGRVRGGDAPGGGLFPAPGDAADDAGDDRSDADGRAAGQLLDARRGHCGPHRLQHFLSRAVWHHDAARDRLACWAVAELAGGQAVLVVDETGDEKSSTDAVGASRQYSGALGGIGLCQVAVHLTYAAESGHALIDRALSLARDWAGDDERRELAHVPDELCFATKPQLAAMLLERARDRGLPARWVAAGEVYGGRDLRMRIRELGYDYTMAVQSGHYVTTRAGRFTAAALTARLPRRAWQRLKTGQGGKGDRHYDWAMIEAVPDGTPPGHAAGHAFLLVRRHRYTRELSFCRCHSAAAVALGDLVAVVCRRWRIEEDFQ